MKKTEKTVLTAALFAAALNMIPSGAGDVTTSASATDYNPAAPPIAYDPSAEEIQDVYGPPIWETTTAAPPIAYDPNNAVEVPVYGPPVSWTTTETELTTQTTTATTEPMPVPVYGPPISWTTTGTELTTQTSTTTKTQTSSGLTLATTTNTIPVAVYGPPIAWYGDINADGRIDVFDMIELRKLYINSTSNGEKAYRADVNQDGDIGMADLVMLNNYLLGKIDDFSDPLPEPKPTTAVSYEPTITTSTEPIPQTEYGPPIAFN